MHFLPDGHSHTRDGDGPGTFATRGTPLERDYRARAFTIGIGGPVGSGKTALLLALCRLLRDKHSLAASAFRRSPTRSSARGRQATVMV